MNVTGAPGNRSRCGDSDPPEEEPVGLPTFSTGAKVRVALTCLLFLTSACCNGAVLWSATRSPPPPPSSSSSSSSPRRRRRPRVRVLLANLALADLLVTLVVMPLDAAWNVTLQWHGGEVACRALMFLKLAAMYASAFVTVVIALDRHAAIVTPLAVGGAERRNKTLLGAAWGLSLVLALPQAFVFRAVTRRGPRRFVQCATLGSFRWRWQETLYNMGTFLFLFLLPLFVMVLCYGRILLVVSGRAKAAGASSQQIQLRRSSDNIPRAKMRALKMSVLIVLTFIICWTPYYLLGLWYWFSPEMLTQEKVPPSLSHILFLFGLFNTCLDPLVYGLFSARFRRELRRLCCHQEVGSVLTGSLHPSPVAAGTRRTGSNPGGAAKHELEATGGAAAAGAEPRTDHGTAESFT